MLTIKRTWTNVDLKLLLVITFTILTNNNDESYIVELLQVVETMKINEQKAIEVSE